MKPRHALEYAALRVALGLFRRLPFAVLRPLLQGLCSLAFALGLRRRVVETNLAAAFGDATSPGAVRGIARECYAEHGRIIAEILKEERFLRSPGTTFDISGIETLRDSVAAGRGTIVLTAHLGNYVLVGYQFARMGYTMAYVSKPVHNPAVRLELEKFYTKHGNTIIPIRGFKGDPAGGMRIFKTLKRGGIVVVINDQDAGPEGYISTFFGRRTSIPSGPAHFAFRTGAAVLTAFITRRDGKIAVRIGAPVDYSTAATPRDAEALILDEYSRRLEEAVREGPALYFWFHKKWKTDPGIRARYEGRSR
jgi:KDO2-lipid IV(A) lauroyltransferase